MTSGWTTGDFTIADQELREHATWAAADERNEDGSFHTPLHSMIEQAHRPENWQLWNSCCHSNQSCSL
jgi:hypothetical protein